MSKHELIKKIYYFYVSFFVKKVLKNHCLIIFELYPYQRLHWLWTTYLFKVQQLMLQLQLGKTFFQLACNAMQQAIIILSHCSNL